MENPMEIDDLGLFPYFRKHSGVLDGSLENCQTKRSWRHLFLRLKAQRSESPAGSDLRGWFSRVDVE